MKTLMSKQFLNAVRIVTAGSSENETDKPALSAPLRYGLPCTSCRLYYSADLSACPICGCGERVSAVV
jgi:rRNA maturation endonuclease Nob1